jgi:hypothetical protein
MKCPETKTYIKLVRKKIKNHPKLFEGYTKGHRIIATRKQVPRVAGDRRQKEGEEKGRVRRGGQPASKILAEP